MTNFEKITASKEVLAGIIMNLACPPDCDCPPDGTHSKLDCKICWLDWLNEEADHE